VGLYRVAGPGSRFPRSNCLQSQTKMGSESFPTSAESANDEAQRLAEGPGTEEPISRRDVQSSSTDSNELDPTVTFCIQRPPKGDQVHVAYSSALAPLVTQADHWALERRFASGVAVQNRYLIDREIGRGGMGQVYLARDLRLARPVALKVCRLLIEGEESDRQRLAEAEASFVEEAQLGASLAHPAIATVYDFGIQEDMPFTVFEYLEGESLRQRMQRQRQLPLEDVRYIIAPLAQALDYAHSRHVVHRDLKPENVRSTGQGHFKILDLGLAREFRLTQDWIGFAGTPAYASPEQAAGKPCDGRTDQYALAAIAFEMLAGERVFTGSDSHELLDKHRCAEPECVKTAASIPHDVRAALLRALSKDPNQRFDSCTEFAAAIGCHVLDESRPRLDILRETNALWLTGGTAVLRLIPNTNRLALTADALWHCRQDVVTRVPLGDVVRISPKPRKQVVPTAAISMEAETVRLANQGRERRIRAYGLVLCFFGLVFAASTLAIRFDGADRPRPPWPVVYIAAAMGAMLIAQGWGIYRLRAWAWRLATGVSLGTAIASGLFSIIAVVLAIISESIAAVYIVLSVPLCIVSAVIANKVLSPAVRFMFSGEYQSIMSATRHLGEPVFQLRSYIFKLVVGSASRRKVYRFRLHSFMECRAWSEQIAGLIEGAKQRSQTQGTFDKPVAILRSRPSVPVQALGRVQSAGERRADAEAGLQIRAAILGADAIVDAEESQLREFQGTVREMVGLAVGAVDSAGKTNLLARWFDLQAFAMVRWLFVLLLFVVVPTLWFASRTGLQSNLVTASSLLWVLGCPCVLCGTFFWLRWPQLAFPTALSVAMLTAAAILRVPSLPTVGLFVASFVIARRAYRSCKTLRSATPPDIREPFVRKLGRYLAWSVVACYPVGLFLAFYNSFLGMTSD
jgi:hypothetical protein